MRKRLACIMLAMMLIATIVACVGNGGGGAEIAPLGTTSDASSDISATQPAGNAEEASENGISGEANENGNGSENGNGDNGNNGESSSEPAGNGSFGSTEVAANGEIPRRSQDVINIFESNNYSMLMELTSESDVTSEFAMTIEMFVGGEDLQLIVVDMLGITLRTLIRDGNAYMLDDANKQYVRDTEDTLGIMTNGLGSADGAIDNDMTYIGSGSDVFLGGTLEYDDFVNGEGDVVRLFFDSDRIAGMLLPENTDEWGNAVVMKIIRLASGVNQSVFEIPGDYTEVDVLDIFGLGDFV